MEERAIDVEEERRRNFGGGKERRREGKKKMRKSKRAIEKDYREDGEDEVRERDFAAE